MAFRRSPALARPMNLWTLPARRGLIVSLPDWRKSMEAILVAIGAVALAEMGDKTQLLAFLLASRFKKPTPIILGILVATIFNHSLASALGAWITHAFSPEVIKWIIVGSFLAMAAWILIPDKGDDDALKNHSMRFGVFGVTFITFFLAEMGDKTQIATVALTVKYAAPVLVVIGTTIGMLIADVLQFGSATNSLRRFRSSSSALPLRLVRCDRYPSAFEYTPTEL